MTSLIEKSINNSLTRSDKRIVTNWLIPYYSAGISVSFPLAANPFTAPQNGIYVCCFSASDSSSTLVINGANSGFATQNGSQYRDRSAMTIPLRQGDVVYWTKAHAGGALLSSVFYPFKGGLNAD